LKIAAAFVGAITDDGAEIEHTRLRREEGFRENDEARTFACGFSRKCSRFLERALAIEGDGSGLDNGGLKRIRTRGHDVSLEMNLAQQSARLAFLE